MKFDSAKIISYVYLILASDYLVKKQFITVLLDYIAQDTYVK